MVEKEPLVYLVITKMPLRRLTDIEYAVASLVCAERTLDNWTTPVASGGEQISR